MPVHTVGIYVATVYYHMLFEVTTLTKTFMALFALIGLFAGMGTNMCFEFTRCRECLIASLVCAFVRLLTGMGTNMRLQCAIVRECLIASLVCAFVIPFSSVPKIMSQVTL